MNKISNARLISFPVFTKDLGILSVYECHEYVPFDIARVFVIQANQNTTRGHHAHKECSQLLVALLGSCTVVCDDGANKRTITLDRQDIGLLIPPTIWAEQQYVPGTILMVMTDKKYDEDDYIRNYDDFINFRNVLNKE